MSNKELLKNINKEYDEHKNELMKDLKDYHFGELYAWYEIKEWLEYYVDTEWKDNELIEYLKTKEHPLNYVYDLYIDREDTLWADFADMINYDMNWRKQHEE